MTADECDARLLAACLLLAIDPVEIQEKAGVLEFGCGYSRYDANREALFRELKRRNGVFSRSFVGEFFDAALEAVKRELSNGWPRKRTAAWVIERMRENVLENGPSRLAV